MNQRSVIKMKGILGLLLLLGQAVSGQHHMILHITNEDSHQFIAGASVMIKGLNKGWVSDSAGFVHIDGISRGIYQLQITCPGYMSREIKLDFPAKDKDTLLVTLEQDIEMLGEVIINSSRTNSRIKDL